MINLTDFLAAVVEKYWFYLSDYMKQKVRYYIKNKLKETFSFNLFGLLVATKAKIDLDLALSLQNFLQNTERKDPPDVNQFIRYPLGGAHRNLDNTGYWCFSNKIPKYLFTA